MLFPGDVLGKDNQTCYLPFFPINTTKNNVTEFKDTWFIGFNLLNEYYLVFDQRPFVLGKGYIQIGIAEKDPANHTVTYLDYGAGERSAWADWMYRSVIRSMIITSVVAIITFLVLFKWCNHRNAQRNAQNQLEKESALIQ